MQEHAEWFPVLIPALGKAEPSLVQMKLLVSFTGFLDSSSFSTAQDVDDRRHCRPFLVFLHFLTRLRSNCESAFMMSHHISGIENNTEKNSEVSSRRCCR